MSEASCKFHKTERKSNRSTSNWRSVSAAQWWWWCGWVFFAKHTTTLLLSDSLPQCSSVYTRKHYGSLPTPYKLLKHYCPVHATECHSAHWKRNVIASRCTSNLLPCMDRLQITPRTSETELVEVHSVGQVYLELVKRPVGFFITRNDGRNALSEQGTAFCPCYVMHFWHEMKINPYEKAYVVSAQTRS